VAATKNPFIGWGASKPTKPPTAGLPGGLETCNSGSRSIIDRPKSLFFLFLFSSFLLSLSLASFWFYSLMFVYCVCLPWGVYVHAYSITGNVLPRRAISPTFWAFLPVEIGRDGDEREHSECGA